MHQSAGEGLGHSSVGRRMLACSGEIDRFFTAPFVAPHHLSGQQRDPVREQQAVFVDERGDRLAVRAGRRTGCGKRLPPSAVCRGSLIRPSLRRVLNASEACHATHEDLGCSSHGLIH